MCNKNTDHGSSYVILSDPLYHLCKFGIIDNNKKNPTNHIRPS